MERLQDSVVRTIRRQITILNAIIVLIIYIFLFLVIKFMYLVLEYIPVSSIVLILTVSALLMVIGLYLANNASKVAIEKIKQYSKRLNALLESTREIGEITYIDLLLNRIVDSSIKLTEADTGAIMLLDSDGLTCKAVKGTDSDPVPQSCIPVDRGIIGWVVRNAEAVKLTAPHSDDRYDPVADVAIRAENGAVLCVPLKLSSGVIGAIQHFRANGSFTDEDELVLKYFADHAAVAIERTQFIEDRRVYEIHITNMLVEIMDNFLSEKKGHAKRVAKYSLMMARALEMSEEEKKTLYLASLLHDIGFLKMPPDRVLTRKDFESHVELGYEMLKPINFYAAVAKVILHHHERYDGRGYPSGLAGEQIPLHSRILAIAEAFDAMVSRASYKYTDKTDGSVVSVMGIEEAIEEIRRHAGTQFDPQLSEIFISNIDEEYIQE